MRTSSDSGCGSLAVGSVIHGMITCVWCCLVSIGSQYDTGQGELRLPGCPQSHAHTTQTSSSSHFHVVKNNTFCETTLNWH